MLDTHALTALDLMPIACFDGFPYLVTRVVPSMYHVILLPHDADDLVEIARRQATANQLPTCLVLRKNAALFIDSGGLETLSTAPPAGGVVVTDRLRAPIDFSLTEDLQRRRREFIEFIEAASPRVGYMLGDLTKGGRPAILDERVLLDGQQVNGIPRGLERCFRCGEWCGRCLDPSPQFAGLVVDVHCRCANDNRCAACGVRLHARRLNGNQYSEQDRTVWHTPGFVAFGHKCDGAAISRSARR